MCTTIWWTNKVFSHFKHGQATDVDGGEKQKLENVSKWWKNKKSQKGQFNKGKFTQGAQLAKAKAHGDHEEWSDDVRSTTETTDACVEAATKDAETQMQQTAWNAYIKK